MDVTQQFQNFDYEFLLPVPNAFTVATEEYYARRYKMNDAKAHSNVYHNWSIINLCFEVENHVYWLI